MFDKVRLCLKMLQLQDQVQYDWEIKLQLLEINAGQKVTPWGENALIII